MWGFIQSTLNNVIDGVRVNEGANFCLFLVATSIKTENIPLCWSSGRGATKGKANNQAHCFSAIESDSRTLLKAYWGWDINYCPKVAFSNRCFFQRGILKRSEIGQFGFTLSDDTVVNFSIGLKGRPACCRYHGKLNQYFCPKGTHPIPA